jgi:hypothetical protein
MNPTGKTIFMLNEGDSEGDRKTGNKKGATFFNVTPCFYSGGRCETRTRDLWFRRPQDIFYLLVDLFLNS